MAKRFTLTEETLRAMAQDIKAATVTAKKAYMLAEENEDAISKLKPKLDAYPELTKDMLKDGITRGFKNGQFEDIAGAGYFILAQAEDTAYSIALNALKTGKLSIPSDATPEMVQEVAELLGEPYFSELSQANVSTLELKPLLSEAEELEKAKREYDNRKAQQAMVVKQAEEWYEKQKLSKASDVEPLNED